MKLLSIYETQHVIGGVNEDVGSESSGNFEWFRPTAESAADSLFKKPLEKIWCDQVVPIVKKALGIEEETTVFKLGAIGVLLTAAIALKVALGSK